MTSIIPFLKNISSLDQCLKQKIQAPAIRLNFIHSIHNDMDERPGVINASPRKFEIKLEMGEDERAGSQCLH
jgi:hypothetical protein